MGVPSWCKAYHLELTGDVDAARVQNLARVVRERYAEAETPCNPELYLHEADGFTRVQLEGEGDAARVVGPPSLMSRL